MTIIWCMVPEIWNATDKFFWQLGRHSLLFYLPSNPENQNFKKMKKKKTHGDIILLHKCIKNHDHIYAIPEIWHVTDVIFLFFTLDYFLPWRAEK